MLGLLEKHKVEGLFAGHVHNFWYHQHQGTQCWLLPSTAFVRQDYAEMFRVAPQTGTESGRNDAPKLGYFVVHVHERGHLCEIVRTYGEVVQPNVPLPVAVDQVQPIHPLENPVTRFGFDMRQNWLEVIEIPPSGGLDEFDRKRTRNDYALMALMEMGVRRLRIPTRDLLDSGHRERLEELKDLGFLFTLFSFGPPDVRLIAAIKGARGLIDKWEVAHRSDALADLATACAPVAETIDADMYISKLRGKDSMEKDGEKYYHMINHGFTSSEGNEIATLKDLPGVTGVIFRVAGETSPLQAAKDAMAVCRPLGLKASLHIRMSLGSPGAVQADDNWIAHRAGEALAAAHADADVHAYSDTFADVDRGYFTRCGVVDRLYNPRSGFHILRHLNAALAAAGSGDWKFRNGDRETGSSTADGDGHLVNLKTGERRTGDAGDLSQADSPAIWIA